MDNDAIFWKGIMLGNKEMFLALYRKYYYILFFIGLKEVKESQIVKDIIQEQFLYLWEKRETIQEAKNVKSYLITSFLRRLNIATQKSRKIFSLSVERIDYSVELQASPEEDMIQRDDQNYFSGILMTSISALPTRQKELIILKYYEGLTYEQISERTGLTRRTVYNKIYEALNKMKLDLDTTSNIYRTALTVICLVTFLSYSSLVILKH